MVTDTQPNHISECQVIYTWNYENVDTTQNLSTLYLTKTPSESNVDARVARGLLRLYGGKDCNKGLPTGLE